MNSEHQTTLGSETPGLPDATLRSLDVGQLIAGRFRLVRPLGKGGMGVVWLAKDESLGEDVAFKFLAEIVAHDEAAIHDLKRELRRTRQLTHHHIIRVHDLVEDAARGVAGITMEVAAGGSLAARRAKTEHGWFEPHEIAEWVRQLGEALDYAHRIARVVHRDLKPANLLLDAEGRLKIADFGIAAALHESATRLTAGKVSGTPLYMSPEQWQGYPPTPSDDLYALGSTIYDLLTGKPPFYSGNIAAAALNLPPAPLTQRRLELHGVEAPVPPEWEAMVAALLEKTAAQRPTSAGAAIAQLAPREEIPVARAEAAAEREKPKAAPRPRVVSQPVAPVPTKPPAPEAPTLPAAVSRPIAAKAPTLPGAVPTPTASRRRTIIACAGVFGVLVVLAYSILQMGDGQQSASNNMLTGKVVGRSFTPPKTEIGGEGGGGPENHQSAGEYILKVRVAGENRVYEVPVEANRYEAVLDGAPFSFLRPPSEQRQVGGK